MLESPLQPPHDTGRRVPRLEDPRAFAAFAVLLVAAAWIVFHRFTVDDAFIAYRHARNLARGLGPVMNPGERVEGISNLPWTVLLGAAARIGVAPHVAGPILSTLCGLLCLPATAAVAWRWTGDARTAAVAAVLCAAGPPLAIWSASGMVTASVALLLLGLAASLAREPGSTRRPGVATGVALGALATLRPEGAMFALPVLVAWRRPEARGALRRVALVAAALVAPVVIFRRAYYGDWLPNPVYAKLPEGTEALASGLAYILQFAAAFPLALVAAAGLAGEARRAPVAALVASAVAMQLLFALAVGGDHFPGYRFVAPVWPLLALAMARHFSLGAAPWMRGWPRAVLLAGALLAVALLLLPHPFLPLAERAALLQRLQRPPSAHAERLQLEIRHAGATLLAFLVCGAVWGGPRGAARRAREAASGAASGAALSYGRNRASGSLAAAGMWLLLVACTLAPAALDPRLRAALRADAASRYGRPVGEWLRAHLPADSRVATNAAGSLPYWSDLPVIDMLGLTDREIGRRPPDPSQWIGHERGDGAVVLERRPAIIVFGGPEGSFEPWPFRSDREIAAHPDFRRLYVPERVPLDGFDFVFYRRRDVAIRVAAAP